MLLFVAFLASIGLLAESAGFLAISLSHWRGLSLYPLFTVQVVLLSILFGSYIFLLERFFLKLYAKMNLTFQSVSWRGKVIARCLLFTLMLFHFYALSLIQPAIANWLYFDVVSFFLSALLGLAVKAIMDETYRIRMSSQTQESTLKR